MPTIGQQYDAAQLWYRGFHRLEFPEQNRGVAASADEQGWLFHTRTTDLRMLHPIEILVAIDAECAPEACARVRPCVFIQVLVT